MACDIEKTASGVIFRNPVAALIVVCLLLIAYLLSPGSWLPSPVGFVFCRGIRRPIADGIRYIFHNPSVIGYNSAHLTRYQRHRATKGSIDGRDNVQLRVARIVVIDATLSTPKTYSMNSWRDYSKLIAGVNQ